MEDDSTTAQAATLFTGDTWFDPIEAGIRERIRGFIEALFEEELTAALGRGRCERAIGAPTGYRNGTRERHLLGSFVPYRSACPAPGWSMPMAAHGSGAAQCCPATPG